MKIKIILISFIMIGLGTFACAQNFMDAPLFMEEDSTITYETLLKGYLSSNHDLERMQLRLEEAQLSREQSDIKNTVSLSLSSGSSKVVLGGDEGTTVSVSPSVQFSMPELNGLSVNASVPSEVSSDGYKVKGTSVSVGADIVSNKRLETQVLNLEADRKVVTAERNLENQQIATEETFLQEISDLYDKALNVLAYRETYLDKVIAFEQIKVEGYAKNSSRYKIALMEKDGAYNDCARAYRELKTLLSEFSQKCGMEVTCLLSQIPQVELLDFCSFDMNSYVKIENAKYQKDIGDLKRTANNTWSLGASLNYEYSTNNNRENYTVGTGFDASYKGLSLGVGVDIPLTQESNPAISFSIGLNPFEWKNVKITEQQNNLTARMEELDLLDAYEDYRTAKNTWETKAEDLVWENNLLVEQNNYYLEILRENQKAYKTGLINETDYIKTENQYMKAKISLLKNKINQYKYNLDLQKDFIQKVEKE